MISEGIDEGSTYVDLECDFCKTIIGKSYKSTTSVTDLYRDTFSFDMDKIKSYVIGSCNLSRKDGVITTVCKWYCLEFRLDSNSILLSFDAERAMNDSETLEQLRAIINDISQRVYTLEHNASVYSVY